MCSCHTPSNEQFKTRPDPIDSILYCASATAITLNTKLENPHRKYAPIARAHCTAHCIGTPPPPQFGGCVKKTSFRGVPTLPTGTSSRLSHPTHPLMQLEFRISLDNVSHYFRVLLIETCRCKDGAQVSNPKNFGAWQK